MLLKSRVYVRRRSGTGTCIARLKMSVWKRQSFKIKNRASACNLREELGRAHHCVLQIVHNRIEMLGTQLRSDKVRRMEETAGKVPGFRDATRKQFLY